MRPSSRYLQASYIYLPLWYHNLKYDPFPAIHPKLLTAASQHKSHHSPSCEQSLICFIKWPAYSNILNVWSAGGGGGANRASLNGRLFISIRSSECLLSKGNKHSLSNRNVSFSNQLAIFFCASCQAEHCTATTSSANRGYIHQHDSRKRKDKRRCGTHHHIKYRRREASSTWNHTNGAGG